ncbi:MAG: ArnT family glycosyltransferase [Pyrinomonadaceae bacterium]
MRTTLICVVIFLVALVVRGFHWQDNPIPPFHGMTGEYKAHALDLVNGDLKGFVRGPSPPSDANVIKHPPGYPLLMAVVYKVFGESDSALRLLHIVGDGCAALLVFFIAYELFSFAIATLSGFLVALSPQLAYHSVALLPDPLAAPPLLLAVYLLIGAYKHPRLLTIFAAGFMIGVSCWFRSNTLLLPLFVCALFPLLFQRGVRVRFAATLLSGFLLLVVPVTIRNAIFFCSLVPLSLSAGITLVEGIGVYDREKRFGLPDNDYLVSKWEAETFQRPDYLSNRFGVDGVMRERYRIKRGLAVITAQPFWFSRVMAHRGLSMLRLTRVELVRAQPAVTHSLDIKEGAAPSWTVMPSSDEANISRHSAAKLSVGTADRNVRMEDAGRGFVTFASPAVSSNTDYLLLVPVKVEHGSVGVEVLDAQQNTLALSPARHPVNWMDLEEKDQPERILEVPFVSGNTTSVNIRLRTESGPLALELGPMKAFALGPASQTWTRYPRQLLSLVQKSFITAVMLPFTLVGVIALARRRRWVELALLGVVPIYYMCVQSALWTEFRYILSMHYFLFIFAAVGFGALVSALRRRFLRRSA